MNCWLSQVSRLLRRVGDRVRLKKIQKRHFCELKCRHLGKRVNTMWHNQDVHKNPILVQHLVDDRASKQWCYIIIGHLQWARSIIKIHKIMAYRQNLELQKWTLWPTLLQLSNQSACMALICLFSLILLFHRMISFNRFCLLHSLPTWEIKTSLNLFSYTIKSAMVFLSFQLSYICLHMTGTNSKY